MDATLDDDDDDTSCLCADCGSEVSPEQERGYRVGDERALCFACAVARGGVYDERLDRWLEAPLLSGLGLDPEHLRKQLPLS